MSTYFLAVCSIFFLISLILILAGWNFATVEKNTLSTVQKKVTWIVVIPLLIFSIFLLFMLSTEYQINGVGNLVTIGGYFLVLSTVSKKFKVKWNLAKILYIVSYFCIGLAPVYVLYFAITEEKFALFEDVPTISLSVAVIAIMILGDVIGPSEN